MPELSAEPCPEDDGACAALRPVEQVCLLTAAIATRSLSWPVVFGEHPVHFFGNDAYYHMRRAMVALATGSVPTFDPYVAYPGGGQPIWPPFFDTLLAGWIAPFHALGGRHAAEVMAAWLPPLLGAVTVCLCASIAARHAGRWAGLFVGATLALLPGHVWFTQLGYVDHHAAVSLLAACLLSFSLPAARDATPPGTRAAAMAALRLGLLMAASLMIWPGALLLVALAQASLVLRAITLQSLPRAARALAWLALANAIAFAGVAPWGLGSDWQAWSPYSPNVLSRFQPWLYAAAALALGLCALLLARLEWRSLAARFAPLAIACGVTLGASLSLLPGLESALIDPLDWLAKGSLFQLAVGESAPLLQVGRSFGMRAAEAWLTYFVYVLPLAWLGLFALRSGRTSFVGPAGTAAALTLAGWVLVLGVAAASQRRFVDAFSVPYGLLMGGAIAVAWQALASRASKRSAISAMAGLLLATLWPLPRSYALAMRNQVEVLRGEKVTIRYDDLRRRALLAGARWLRKATPATEGFRAADRRPEYGVIASWDVGHIIRYVAERAPVVDNFGVRVSRRNFQLAGRYFASPEPRALGIAKQLRGRYVFFRPGDGGGDGKSLPGSVAENFAGEELRLERHRLIYQSPAHPRDPDGLPLLRIFEIVAGADVVGRAAPGAEVSASLMLSAGRGEKLLCRLSVRADKDGEYHLRLPYSTGRIGGAGDTALRGGVAAAAKVQIQSDGQQAELSIPESAVAAGDRVEAPAFRDRPAVANDAMTETIAEGREADHV